MALLLSGCAAQTPPAAESSPDAEATFDNGGPNGVACRAFYVAWPAAVRTINGDTKKADWESEAAKFDEIALKAEGDVKTRMMDFVANWPDLFDVFMLGEIDETNARLGSIERACDAAGENIDGLELTATDK